MFPKYDTRRNSASKNHHGIGSKYLALYSDQALLELVSDITLEVECREYQLHKIVLCAASPVFREMCSYGKPIKEKVVLEETEERAAVFEDFIKYLYTGNITLNLDTVNGIILLADKYQVEDLKGIAKQFRKKHTPGKFLYFKKIHVLCIILFFSRP